MNLDHTTFIGHLVRLEPLGPQHADELASFAGDERIWTYLDEPAPWDRAAVDTFIADAQADRDRGARVAYAIVDQTTGRAIGSTSYPTYAPPTEASRSGGRPGAPAPTPKPSTSF